MSSSWTSDGTARDLTALFGPRRVAVVGASERAGSAGDVLWRNLRSFPGEVVPVSASVDAVGGVRAYASLRDVPGHVDLAVVAVPAARCPDVVRDAAAAGVGCCVIVSGGFAETGPDGEALQAEMVAAARDGGVLLAGPNCLGVQNLALPLNASLAAGTAAGRGGISLLTQSGSYAMAVHTMSGEDGVGFAVAYSAGNRADLGDHEVIEHLRRDPATRVICLFVESVADGRALRDTLRRTTADKPVVLTAVGRSEAGARAAASHTAALAADRRAWDGVLEAAGVTVAASGLEMLDAARLLADQPHPAGDRVAIITNSGGIGTELADLLSAEGLVVPRLSDPLQARLADLLPGHGSPVNPVDLTPVWARFAELYPAVLDLLARSGEVDAVVPVLLHRSAEDPAVAAGIVEVVRALRADGVDVPVSVCWVARREAWPGTAVLHEAGVPCLEWPARTARALGHAARYARRRLAGVRAAPSSPTPQPLPDDVGSDAGATWRFLAAHGLPMAPAQFCATAEAAVAAAAHLGRPTVLKVDHAGLSHKSDVGGVRLGLRDDDEVRAAAGELLGLAAGARLVVQRQLAGVELVVGGLVDPTFGPVVCVGAGGVLVELLGDAEFAPAPLDDTDAVALLERTRAGALLDAPRGGEPADRAAVAALVRSVGDVVATYPQLLELDLNPVLAGPDGCVIVDARVGRAGAGQTEPDRAGPAAS